SGHSGSATRPGVAHAYGLTGPAGPSETTDSLALGDETRLKRPSRTADTHNVDAAERKEILSRYMDHSRRFDEVAARRRADDEASRGATIAFSAPRRELGQEPPPRETEFLQLICAGLVNGEIGNRLFLSEETVKSHVRHLLAKLQARSRAHAVAVGFRRGLIT